jgi:hypothetical protein
VEPFTQLQKLTADCDQCAGLFGTIASSPPQSEDDFTCAVGVMISKSVVQVQEGYEHILGSDD